MHVCAYRWLQRRAAAGTRPGPAAAQPRQRCRLPGSCHCRCAADAPWPAKPLDSAHCTSITSAHFEVHILRLFWRFLCHCRHGPCSTASVLNPCDESLEWHLPKLWVMTELSPRGSLWVGGLTGGGADKSGRAESVRAGGPRPPIAARDPSFGRLKGERPRSSSRVPVACIPRTS